LGQGELNSGDQIAQHRLRSEAENDAGHSRRCKYADPILAHGIERHQDGTQGQQNDDGIEDADQHPHLGDVFARQKIIRNIESEIAQIKIGADLQQLQRGPADQTDRGEHEAANEYQFALGAERYGRERNGQRDQQQTRARGIFRCGQDAVQIGPAPPQHSIK